MPKAEAVSLADYEADEEEGECTSRAPESAAGRKQPAELDKAVTSLLSLRKPPRPGLPSKALPRARAQAAPLRKGDKRHAQRMSARTYFHSKSCQVMTLAEVLGEQDSDDDYDEQECLQLNQRMLDNCAANPTPTEREFMLLWNMYLAKFPVHSDALTPAKCEEFAAHHAAELSRPEMRRSFVMHLVNLFKFGLLAASSVTRCLQVVDSGTTPPE
uniref:Polycomb protein SUZ12 n=1 Tax=Tetraselmis sp. GSL018 TaxID=582737 RepID=A0A061REH5_9CHLO